jgi:hypothetical protein
MMGRLHSIEVTGKEYPLPDKSILEDFKDPYGAIADALSDTHMSHRIKDVVQQNPLLYAKYVLIKGPSGKNKTGFATAASKFADHTDMPLELMLNHKKPDFMGTSLKQGRIIVRGNVGKKTGHSMQGGYLFIEGDVAKIENPWGGVIYVRGDVGEISEMYRGVLIVYGDIKKSSKNTWLNGDVSVSPTPFVFTTEPVELYGYIARGGPDLSRLSNVVPKNEIREISPWDLERRALELCKNRLASELDKKRELLRNVSSVGDAAGFYNVHIDGFQYGMNQRR